MPFCVRYWRKLAGAGDAELEVLGHFLECRRSFSRSENSTIGSNTRRLIRKQSHAKYQYSVIRFVPSPTRGEFVNLGVIVGSDATDEWTMELVGKKSRAAKLDDAGILPLVSTELERLQLRFPGDDEETSYGSGPEINEIWLAEMASQSRNVVQYTPPQPILAADAATAMEKLWNTFIVDVRQKRESLSTRFPNFAT
ncbi:MAG: DUF3037 domain-containing protein [Planctomycetaceae bacterium]